MQTQTVNLKGKKKDLTSFSKKDIVRSAEGFPLVGWCVHWSTSEFSIEFSRFCELLRTVGIDPEIARETLPKHAYLRAVRKSRGKALAPKVLDDQHRAVSVIATPEVDQTSLDVGFQQSTKVVFDKNSRDIVVEGTNARDIKSKFEKYKLEYTSQQFRNVALRYIKRHCNGIMVKDGGGLYLVPAPMENNLNKLDELFELIKKETKAKSDLVILPQPDTQLTRKAMWKAMVGEISNDIGKLKEDFSDKLKEEITEKSLRVRLDKYKKLKTKIEMYEIVLHGSADNLKKGLDELTDLIKKKVIA